MTSDDAWLGLRDPELDFGVAAGNLADMLGRSPTGRLDGPKTRWRASIGLPR